MQVTEKCFKLYSEYKPTLIIAHNKTLAAQLYGKFKGFSQIIEESTLSDLESFNGRRYM